MSVNLLSNRMKILQINKFFYLKGGAERYFFDLADGLDQSEYQILVFSVKSPENFNYPGQENFAPQINLSRNEGWLKDLRKAGKIFWNKQAAKQLEKVIIRQKPDLAHLHNFFGQLSPSIIYTLKKHQIPIVVTLHDYKWFCPNYTFFNHQNKNRVCYDCLKNGHYRKCFTRKCLKESYLKSLLGYLEGKWHKDILKLADKIELFIAPSKFMENKLRQWGIESNKIKQIPNFISQEWIDFKEQNKINQPYFLYYGRLSQEKGINLLIDAFVGLRNEYPDWQLKIVGDGPERLKVAQAAEDYPQIQLMGQLKGNKLKSIIKQSYAVVMPSLWPENFPYVALESFALAKPVIGSRAGGLVELINQERNGLLFKRGNLEDLKLKLAWAIGHPQKMRQKGRLARNDVLKKYRAENHCQKIIKAYQEVQFAGVSNLGFVSAKEKV